MMSTQELEEHLTRLRLSQTEAAQLLGVSPRTVRRWLEGEVVSGPAEAALRAWRRLDKQLLAWRPDSVTIEQNDAEGIARHREHAMGLDDVLRRVKARGGPRHSWIVDLPESTATLGAMHVSFYKLQNGGFSCSVYSRRDMHPDLERDREELEDAMVCIAQAFAKARERAEALRAVAMAVRSNSHIFGSYGPFMPDLAARQERQQLIEGLADAIDRLATDAEEGRATTYREFAAIHRQLSEAGYSPPPRAMISAVAQSYVERAAKVRVLLVRSGRHDEPVTKVIELEAGVTGRLVAGHRLEPLGFRLPVIGEAGPPHLITGAEHVVLDVPRGITLSGAEDPGLYLVADLRPAAVLSAI
jgi:transcriptional regulator with XRE-family HTH domain